MYDIKGRRTQLGLTLEEVGKVFKISRQRVKQIEKTAMDTISKMQYRGGQIMSKHNNYNKNFEIYLEDMKSFDTSLLSK